MNMMFFSDFLARSLIKNTVSTRILLVDHDINLLLKCNHLFSTFFSLILNSILLQLEIKLTHC